MSCIVKPPTSNTRFITGPQQDSIAEIVHVQWLAFGVTNRLAVLPNDLAGTQEDPFRNLVLTTREILFLASFPERLQFVEQHVGDVAPSNLLRFRSCDL